MNPREFLPELPGNCFLTQPYTLLAHVTPIREESIKENTVAADTEWKLLHSSYLERKSSQQNTKTPNKIQVCILSMRCQKYFYVTSEK